jgi:hypothetical protein
MFNKQERMLEIWLILLFDYMLTNLMGIVGILVIVVVPLIGFRYWRRRRLRAYFKIIWKKSSSLKPKDLLELRPYDPYYYERKKEDDLIRKRLNEKKSVLIVGAPLSGKTRAVYQALTHIRKRYDATIPRCINIDLETFSFPKHLKFWRPKLIVMDDLHRFVEQLNFDHFLKECLDRELIIIVTCRSQIEYKKAKNTMASKGIDLETIFGGNAVVLGKVSEDTGKKIAEEAGRDWEKVKFDGTVGSIFMPLLEIQKRFDECGDEEKTILRTLRKLYLCGIYQENQVFPLEWVKKVTQKGGLEGKDFEWAGWLEGLKDKELITLQKAAIQAEEVYLEHIVKPDTTIPILELFEQMLSTFPGIPEPLFMLGNRAYTLGEIDLDRAKYMRLAIQAFAEALKVYTFDRFPIQYATTQNNLGNAYSTLAEVEDKSENCKKAKKAYEETLKVFTKKDFLQVYELVQRNLDNLLRFCEE